MVIKKVPPEDRDMLRRKLLAWEMVGAGSGSGGRRDWGMNRRWYGDYLSEERLGPEYSAAVQDLLTRDGTNNIVFSCRLLKVNKFKKTADRLLLVSEQRICTMDEKKSKLMRDQLLSGVTGVSCGVSGQLVVVHMRDRNDLVGSLINSANHDRVGEFVAVLSTVKKGEKLAVRVTDEIHCSLGGKSQTIICQQDNHSPMSTFTKSKTGFVFTFPA